MNLADIKKTIIDYYHQDGHPKEDIAAVYLFGSVARGTAGAKSDVDLGVLYEEPPGPQLTAHPFRDMAKLSLLIGREVEIVVMNTAPPDLVHRVLRDGMLLLEPNKSKRIAFEVRKRNEYFDILPYLQEYRRSNIR